MQRLIDQTRFADAFTRRVLGECHHLTRILRPLLQQPLWAEVGQMVHLPAASTVLQGRRGYREIYRQFAKLRLAVRIPLDEHIARDLLEAKDIAQLYELWAYFVLVRELQRHIGPPLKADRPRISKTDVSIPWDFEVSWGNGVRLQYNSSFSRSRPVSRRSYSVPLRPDITLVVPSGPNSGLHLFDAKFKVDRLDAVMGRADADDESVEELAEEHLGTFKRGDLYKMHTYRDAISLAQSVWMLYPGNQFRFYSAAGGISVDEVEALPAELDGVGAIPLIPRRHNHLLNKALAYILGLPTPAR
jgi:predicted component of viral defense system (DUF524 family)